MKHPARHWPLALFLFVAGIAFGFSTTFPASEPPGEQGTSTSKAASEAVAVDGLEKGKNLYQRHCAQCHGDSGNGAGIAATFLYPKPRNFQEGKFKLVSTLNRIPTDADLFETITRGMPGSSMIAFSHLPEAERTALVAYVRHLTRGGIETRLKKSYEDAGEEIDAPALAKEVARQTTPGEVLHWLQDLPKEDATAIQRGRTLYLTNCAQCHGETGRGEGGKDQRDDDGTPTKPRDFTQGIFKGSREALPLLQRLQIGMPGTPMPATTHLKPNDLADMVHYIRSLSPAEAQAKVEHRRQALTARQVKTLDEAAWANAPATFVVTSPLWWRDWVNPELEVQALHDGRQLAVRLRWKDTSRNDTILRPQDFEDQASVQLFGGDAEPFIGMGAHGFGVVDIWLWKASQSRDQTASRHQLDEYPFDLPFYGELLKRLPQSSRPVPDFYTARAARNQNSATPEGTSSAQSLTAAGPGSTTFRPKNAQNVAARAEHRDGRWSVTFTRPLSVPAADGSVLARGKTLFIAFSLWDGTASERNGQKQISIWHHLTLE